MALDVFANCVLSLDDEDIFVQAEAENILIELPNLRTGLALVRTQPVRSERIRLITRVQQWLTFADLHVQIHCLGKTIARLGVQSRPGLMSKVLGLGPLELHPVQILSSWWRRRRATSS